MGAASAGGLVGPAQAKVYRGVDQRPRQGAGVGGMAATPDEDDDKGQLTPAGCLLIALSVAVIVTLAVPLVTWRDPDSGRPLPRMVAILAPFLAGALCYGLGAAILRILGLPVSARSRKDSSDRPGDGDAPPRGE
jgi:hypothetical protein